MDDNLPFPQNNILVTLLFSSFFIVFAYWDFHREITHTHSNVWCTKTWILFIAQCKFVKHKSKTGAARASLNSRKGKHKKCSPYSPKERYSYIIPFQSFYLVLPFFKGLIPNPLKGKGCIYSTICNFTMLRIRPVTITRITQEDFIIEVSSNPNSFEINASTNNKVLPLASINLGSSHQLGNHTIKEELLHQII